MIRTIGVIIVCLLVSLQLSHAQEFLLAEPMEPTDYYLIKVNGSEVSVISTIDELFFQELHELEAGKHKLTITSGSFEYGDGGSVRFDLTKRVTNKHTTYTIIRLKQEQKKDPTYNDKFDVPLKIKVKNTSNESSRTNRTDWKDWKDWYKDQNRKWPGWKNWKDWHKDPNHNWDDWREWQKHRKEKWQKLTNKEHADTS